MLPPLQITEGTESGECPPSRIMYPCTDSARHKYYKHEDTGWTLDAGAPFLNTAIDALYNVANDHIDTLNDVCVTTKDEIMKEIYKEKKQKLI